MTLFASYHYYGIVHPCSLGYGSSIQYYSEVTYNLVMECCPGYEDPAGGLNCGRKHTYLNYNIIIFVLGFEMLT